jgi:formylglycine-generating enzyme required for sulfatase activity
MKKTTALLALGITLLALPIVRAQGTLTPPGSPAPTQKSLQEIWDKLEKLSSDIPTLIQQAIPPVQGMVPVLGGVLPQGSELAGQRVATFYIGRYEVSWLEWQEVRDWAVANGYSDLVNKGAGSADNHPVRNVNWYDVVKWCNAKSEKYGLIPVYSVNGTVYRNGEFGDTESTLVLVNGDSTGYRLIGDAEWEWAARGGKLSQGHVYSGSSDPDSVAWYYDNSIGAFVNQWDGRGTWPVGLKLPNEIGVYDMSGNVWEWTWDLSGDSHRRIRGGAWGHPAISSAIGRRDGRYGPATSEQDIGFRLARNFATAATAPTPAPGIQ